MEFTLVSVLVVLIVAGVLQLALTLHVRNTLISSAAAGARVAAAQDRALDDGERRAEELIHSALGGYAVEVTARATVIDGAPAVAVSVTAPVPTVGLWGFGTMRIEARALVEVDRE